MSDTKSVFIRNPRPSVKCLYCENVEYKVLNVKRRFCDSTFPVSRLALLTSCRSQVRLTRVGSRTALLPWDSQVKPPAARDLLYLAPSPDFCHLDPENGIPGTAGRRCNGERTTTDTLLKNFLFWKQVLKSFSVLKLLKTTQEPLGWHPTAASSCAAGRDTEQAGQKWCNAAPASFPGAAQFAVSSARTQSPSTLAGFKPTQTRRNKVPERHRTHLSINSFTAPNYFLLRKIKVS